MCTTYQVNMSLIKTLVIVALTGASYLPLCRTYNITYNNKIDTKILQQSRFAIPWSRPSILNTKAELLSDAETYLNGKPRYVQARRSLRKRNPINLYNMIGCATKCSPWNLLSYGNYCGLGGSGTSVDIIDRCCHDHDDCYGVVLKNNCWRLNVYLLPYEWSCVNGEPHCNRYQSNTCRRKICYCDKKFTECLNRAGCPY